MPVIPERCCLTCDYWFCTTPDGELTTHTLGACNAVGAALLETTPEHGCQLWTPVMELPEGITVWKTKRRSVER
jgi:hypothetical protein